MPSPGHYGGSFNPGLCSGWRQEPKGQQPAGRGPGEAGHHCSRLGTGISRREPAAAAFGRRMCPRNNVSWSPGRCQGNYFKVLGAGGQQVWAVPRAGGYGVPLLHGHQVEIPQDPMLSCKVGAHPLAHLHAHTHACIHASTFCRPLPGPSSCHMLVAPSASTPMGAHSPPPPPLSSGRGVI